jgi:hypothetical protein
LLCFLESEAAKYEMGIKQRKPAAARNRIPLPRFPKGKPGREGSPHAAKTAATSARGFAPLRIPHQFSLVLLRLSRGAIGSNSKFKWMAAKSALTFMTFS